MRFTRLARATLGIVIGAAGLALITGAFCLWQWNRPVALPMPSGPFAVGRTWHEWRDFSRKDPLSPVQHQPRQLAIWLWYPSEEGPLPGRPASQYLPPAWALPLQKRRGNLYQRLSSVRCHAIDGATISSAQRTYPLLILSPGYGMQPTDYTALAEELASHGYVVAGLLHTYSTPVVVFSDGRLVRSTPKGWLTGDTLADELLHVWLNDIKSTIDEMDRLNNDQHSQFGNRLTNERGILGHSFGGAAAVAACNWDTRCTA